MHPPKILTAVLAAVALTSCMTPDPMFLENAGRVQNANYPPNKIVGTWVHFSVNPVQSDTLAMEHKLYLEILPRGRGKVQELASNVADGSRLVVEAPLTWSYEGRNLWQVTLPPASAYQVIENDQVRHVSGNGGGASRIPLRYYEGNLYDFDEKQVFVPANQRSVSALTGRMRQATPVLRLNTTQ
ncbi:MAG: hypothetical protein PHC88_09385 [Terrimicrobiaceae bacterium]|nr:hypothetical protein [Terrimicrobiaceae bacterium]